MADGWFLYDFLRDSPKLPVATGDSAWISLVSMVAEKLDTWIFQRETILRKSWFHTFLYLFGGFYGCLV